MPDRPPFGRLALVGTTGVGKSTLFSALTGMEYARVIASSGRVLSAPVRVEAERLLRIHHKEEPKAKLTCPTFELWDTPALSLDEEDRSRSVLHKLREADGLIVLLNGFEQGGLDTDKQFDAIRSELLLNDADALQRRLKRNAELVKRSIPRDEREPLEAELDALPPVIEALTEGETDPLKDLSPTLERRIRSFGLYARMPIISLVNLPETGLDHKGVCIRLEHELLGMEPEERDSFMGDYGLDRLQIPDLPLTFAEKTGNLIFLTVGPTEVAGWPLPTGTTAPEAAGVIHTDLQKGFINAEVIAYRDWEEAGSMREAERKKQRLEGKDYVVQPYDIINIKSAR